MNLIENAIKYTSKAKKADGCVWVSVSEDRDRKKIVVKVRDNGLGISSEDINRLFEKFYRGKDKSIIATEGTGLGLYIARQIINEHKGEVWVKSEGEMKGSEFTFEIPVLEN